MDAASTLDSTAGAAEPVKCAAAAAIAAWENKRDKLTSQVMSGFKSAPPWPRTATKIKNKGVCKIPSWIFQPKGKTCVAQGKSLMMSMGRATCERPGPALAATSKRTDVMLGDRKQEEKLVLCLHIFPSQRGVKGPELYKLPPSTIASPQSC